MDLLVPAVKVLVVCSEGGRFWCSLVLHNIVEILPHIRNELLTLPEDFGLGPIASQLNEEMAETELYCPIPG